MGVLWLSFHYNGEIRKKERKKKLRHSTNHILNSEDLKTGWHFGFTHAIRLGLLYFPPVIRTMTGSSGEKRGL
jgi:hypothetical protein